MFSQNQKDFNFRNLNTPLEEYKLPVALEEMPIVQKLFKLSDDRANIEEVTPLTPELDNLIAPFARYDNVYFHRLNLLNSLYKNLSSISVVESSPESRKSLLQTISEANEIGIPKALLDGSQDWSLEESFKKLSFFKPDYWTGHRSVDFGFHIGTAEDINDMMDTPALLGGVIGMFFFSNVFRIDAATMLYTSVDTLENNLMGHVLSKAINATKFCRSEGFITEGSAKQLEANSIGKMGKEILYLYEEISLRFVGDFKPITEKEKQNLINIFYAFHTLASITAHHVDHAKALKVLSDSCTEYFFGKPYENVVLNSFAIIFFRIFSKLSSFSVTLKVLTRKGIFVSEPRAGYIMTGYHRTFNDNYAIALALETEAPVASYFSHNPEDADKLQYLNWVARMNKNKLFFINKSDVPSLCVWDQKSKLSRDNCSSLMLGNLKEFDGKPVDGTKIGRLDKKKLYYEVFFDVIDERKSGKVKLGKRVIEIKKHLVLRRILVTNLRKLRNYSVACEGAVKKMKTENIFRYLNSNHRSRINTSEQFVCVEKEEMKEVDAEEREKYQIREVLFEEKECYFVPVCGSWVLV